MLLVFLKHKSEVELPRVQFVLAHQLEQHRDAARQRVLNGGDFSPRLGSLRQAEIVVDPLRIASHDGLVEQQVVLDQTHAATSSVGSEAMKRSTS